MQTIKIKVLLQQPLHFTECEILSFAHQIGVYQTLAFKKNFLKLFGAFKQLASLTGS